MVIHSFAVPSLSVKCDAYPGRTADYLYMLEHLKAQSTSLFVILGYTK